MKRLCLARHNLPRSQIKKIDWPFVLLALFSFFGAVSKAEDGLVEVEYPQALVLPYKDRRSPWSFTTSIIAENRKPENFVSIEGDSYETLFEAKTFNGVGLGLGAQYNFEAFAVGLIANYTSGVLSRDTGQGFNDLKMDRISGGVEFLLDAIWSEPRVVPLLRAQVYKINWNLQTETGEDVGDSDLSYLFSGGLLIQMNAIEPEQAGSALFEYGLQNTFIELLATQYSPSPNDEDPDFSESLALSLSLRMEFQ